MMGRPPFTEHERREKSKLKGKDFVSTVRRMFGDCPLDGIQVIKGPDYTWYVQRHEGKVVGAGWEMNGERMMVAGGPVIDAPVSAAPIYDAMNADGVRPSKKLSPWGADAQRKAGELNG